MSADCRSTITFRSNLQPVKGSCLTDTNFLKTIRDPFALYILNELLKKYGNGYRLSAMQQEEYDKASGHCAYAAKDDYPWGTIRQEDGTEVVVCKCINTKCSHFTVCRPDFQESELLIIEENLKQVERSAEFVIDKDPYIEENRDSGDKIAAELLVSSLPSDEELIHDVALRDKRDSEMLPTRHVLPAVSEVVKHDSLDKKYVDQQVGFSSFIEASQESVIESDVTERTLINAGPGTGKTWTLIEKLIYMVEEKEIDPEGILVLCFSRAAVEVIEQRLQAAADANRIGYDWRKIEIRTFDSFATYLIAWVQERYPDLLPENYILEAQDYDTRIHTAIHLLKKKEDMFSQYEHIVIDEVQDLVGCRAEFVLQILSILPAGCGFTLLGDACQALYDWQAKDDPSIMSSEDFYTSLFKEYKDINYLFFKENHRQEGDLSLIAIPYRNAILTGTAKDRANAVKNINSVIGTSGINLQHASMSEIYELTKNGTLGILTRTNGQALKISTWLKNADIAHVLQRPATTSYLGGWIAQVLMAYPNQTINEELFSQTFLEQFPSMSMETAKDYWLALISTQHGNQKPRYEVEELLKGLLSNARDKLLFTSIGATEPVIVSNIHRAKGREFDTVLVIDDVLAAMIDDQDDDIQEHKVCYVALTRPRKRLFKASLKNQYIYIDKGTNRRCFQSGGFGNKRYLSHIEIGYIGDLDKNSFAAKSEIQSYIKNELTSDTRLKLRKCPEGDAPYVIYRLVPEENENMVLGYTGKPFADSIQRAIQRIFNNPCRIGYRYYPNIFSDVYVDNLITCISVSGKSLPGAKAIGDFGIWMGFTVSGFAQMEKDRY